MNLYCIAFARDRRHVKEKINELEGLDLPYTIVCGEQIDHHKVVYREPRGKYDAINASASLIPQNVDIVMFNDADAKIGNFHTMLNQFGDATVGIVFASESVMEGPQRGFFALFNPLRKLVPLAASGELMMIRQPVLNRILPLKPCKAEDTYLMFKALELGYRVVFCDDCAAETERTKTAIEEECYKRRTVAGIYQALSITKPPPLIRSLYAFLPLIAVFFILTGRNGYHTFKGILLGFLDYARGDRSGTWKASYEA